MENPMIDQAARHLHIESSSLIPAIPQIPRNWIAAGIAFGVGLVGCYLLEMSALQEAVLLLFFVASATPLSLFAWRAHLLRISGRDIPDRDSITTTTLAVAFPVCVSLAVTVLFYLVDSMTL